MNRAHTKVSQYSNKYGMLSSDCQAIWPVQLVQPSNMAKDYCRYHPALIVHIKSLYRSYYLLTPISLKCFPLPSPSRDCLLLLLYLLLRWLVSLLCRSPLFCRLELHVELVRIQNVHLTADTLSHTRAALGPLSCAAQNRQDTNRW